MMSTRKFIGISIFALILWFIVSFFAGYIAEMLLTPFGLEYDLFWSTVISSIFGAILVYFLFKSRPVFVRG